MSLMQAPVGIMILHRAKVQEELERNRHPRVSDLSLPRRQPRIRTAIGHLLVAAGSRLNPAAGAPPATPVLQG